MDVRLNDTQSVTEQQRPQRESEAPQPARESPRTAWWQAAAIQAVALAVALGVLLLVRNIAHQLALLLAAIVIAEAASPLVVRLSRYMPRAAAVLLVYVVGILFFVLAFWFVAPGLIQQGQDLLERAPGWLNQLQGVLSGEQGPGVQTWVEPVRGLLANVAGGLVTLPLTIIGGLFELIVLVVISIYWAISAPSIKDFFLSLFPNREREKAGAVFTEIGETMGGYVRAALIDAVILGVLVYVGLMIIGVPYPAVLGMVSALGELVPVLGPFIGGFVAVGVTLLAAPDKVLMVLVYYIVLQQLESHLLVPKLMQNQAHVPPVLAIFALLAGAALGGILLALVAIPLSGALLVIVRRVVAPMVRSWSGAPATGEAA